MTRGWMRRTALLLALLLCAMCASAEPVQVPGAPQSDAAEETFADPVALEADDGADPGPDAFEAFDDAFFDPDTPEAVERALPAQVECEEAEPGIPEFFEAALEDVLEDRPPELVEPGEEEAPAPEEEEPSPPGEESPSGGEEPSPGGEEPSPAEEIKPREVVFKARKSATNAVWENVNLVCARKYTGKLARVHGTLTLRNAWIGGRAAANVNLAACFDLSRCGRVVIDGMSPLQPSFNAIGIDKGKKRTLRLYRDGAALNGAEVRWHSSKPSVAKVSSTGIITAKKAGSAKITATVSGVTVTVYVVVNTPVKSISLKKSLQVSKYHTAKLTVKFSPRKPSNKTITWKSSNTKVATVSKNGVVKAKRKGSAVITAISANGKRASCRVNVKVVPLRELSFRKMYLTIRPGKQAKARVSMSPWNASAKLKFSSSNRKIARVNSKGVITGVKPGRVTITARSASNGKIRAKCTVFVVKKGSGRLAGITIGINPGHQITPNLTWLPLAPDTGRYGIANKAGSYGRWSRAPEYRVTLQVALKLAKMLRKHGAKVVLTRNKSNVNINNIDRAKKLNRAGVDVALQLHCDAAGRSSARGISLIYRDRGSWVRASKALASALRSKVPAATGCRVWKVMGSNDYMSLNWSETPSVLFEMGFMTNKEEDLLLSSASYQNRLVRGTYNALCSFFGR